MQALLANTSQVLGGLLYVHHPLPSDIPFCLLVSTMFLHDISSLNIELIKTNTNNTGTAGQQC
jgi:hypothetical protein